MSELPTILIVDDEAQSLETMRHILEKGFEVKTAATRREAEGVLECEWARIILRDQRLPDRIGVAFLEVVRSFGPRVVSTVH